MAALLQSVSMRRTEETKRESGVTSARSVTPEFSMYLRTLLGASALALSLAANPAFAQDSEFSGPYVGGSLGLSIPGKQGGESIEFDRDLNGSFGDTVVTSGNLDAFAFGFCNGAALGGTRTGCRDDANRTQYAARLG